MIARSWQMLKSDGILYIVLPKPCLYNSRYCNDIVWNDLMTSIGFQKLNGKVTDRLVYWIGKKIEKGSGVILKKEVMGGKTRNNFCVVWKGWDHYHSE